MKLAGKLDLALGIVLGVVAGLAVAYLLVFVIGHGGSSSSISTESATREQARPEGPARAAP